MIEIQNLRKTYKMGDVEVQALRGASLTIDQGDFVAIMGASGSGKSTLLQLLGLLDTPDSGSYKLAGKEVANLSQDQMATVRSEFLGFVFQQFNLLARTTAEENTALPLLYSDSGLHTDPKELLKQVGLGERMHHKPNEMSGGQQQRVAIARALVNNPRVVLADEPTGNLDSQSSEEILDILEGLNSRGITVVMVTHEPDIAAHARRVIHMKDGQIISDERIKPIPISMTPEGDLSVPHEKHTKDRYISYLRQAGRALLANKVRTSLSVLGILIGVAAVIAMMAIGNGAKKSMQAQLASLGSNLLILQPGNRSVGGVSSGFASGSRLTLDDVDAIQSQIPHVRRTAPEVGGGCQMVYESQNWNTRLTGTTPNYAEMRASQAQVGRFFTDDEVQSREKVVLLGITVIKQLYPNGENPIGTYLKINRIAFQVIGILPTKGANGFRDQDDAIVVPVTTAMYRLLGKQYVDDIDIEVDAPENIDSVQTALSQFMRKRHRLPDNVDDDFQIRNMAEMLTTFTSTTNTITMLLSCIAAISLLVGGIGIMNIMLVSVTERTHEIGLRKALGAKARDILSQFLLEAVVVSVAGGLGGVLLGVGISFGITTFAKWPAALDPTVMILAVLFSGAIGVIFGLWPAKKASALDPIVALRYE
jgi:macrolide transport system ATP-binding/permease protein